MKKETTISQEQYNAIDILKFICAILICTIHVSPFPNNVKEYGEINFYIINCIARLAIPFFFTATGFFLFNKTKIDNIDTKVIKEYCFKLLRLLGTWWVILTISPKNHLWYLGGSVIAILFITYLLKKKIKMKYIITIAAILFIIGLMGDTYYEITKILKENTFLNTIIKYYEEYFTTTRPNISFKWAYIGAFVSYTLLMIETTYLVKYSHPKDYNIYLFAVPLIFFVFNILLNVKLKPKTTYKKLRIISILFYFSHRMFVVLSYNLISFIYIHCKLNLENYHFLLTVILTLAFSLLIEELSKTKKLKVLKYLYS